MAWYGPVGLATGPGGWGPDLLYGSVGKHTRLMGHVPCIFMTPGASTGGMPSVAALLIQLGLTFDDFRTHDFFGACT